MQADGHDHLDGERRRYELTIRELHHRFSNDMQLILSLLQAEARKAIGIEARDVLSHAAERVSIVAARRRAMLDGARNDLAAALEQVCGALDTLAQASPAKVRLVVAESLPPQAADTILPLALAVNELVTNALKHGFRDGEERAEPGLIQITAQPRDGGGLTVVVEDNGAPFQAVDTGTHHYGIDLVRRLVSASGALLIAPPPGSKRFEIRVAGR